MITIALILIVIVALYLYGTRNFKYWEQRGVQHDKPIPFFGNNLKNFFLKRSVTQLLVEMYWKYPKAKIVGFYRASNPQLIIRDPEIVKQVLTTDFAYFYARGLQHKNIPVEPLLKNLFTVDGDTWRLLRQRMTPAFSSGKLKAMFPLIVERAGRLQEQLHSATTAGREIDARDLMARYTTDFIGACGFGIDADTLHDENSAFRKVGATIFNFGFKDMLVLMLKEIAPQLFKHLKRTSRMEKAVFSLVNTVLRQRNYQHSSRNDFIDLLLECKGMGTMTGDSIERVKPDGTPEIATLEMDDELLAAQVFIFFAAGFETSSSATSFTLHELSYNINIQEKVQNEIDRVLAKYNNEFCYEAINEMTYLQWIFKEGMRIFPPIGFLMRECTRKYTFKELDLTIDEGVRIFIPVQALQNDSKYFNHPTEFRPERFSPENFDLSNKHVYLPFGEGPRACIGERLGIMQSVAGLAAVLSRFIVRPAPSSRRHPITDPASGVVQVIKGGLPLLFIERSSK